MKHVVRDIRKADGELKIVRLWTGYFGFVYGDVKEGDSWPWKVYPTGVMAEAAARRVAA